MRDIFDPDLKFGFDIDGVLSNTFPKLVRVCQDRGILPMDFDVECLANDDGMCGPRGQINLTPTEIDEIFTGEFFADLEPLDGVKDVRDWVRQGIDATFITARHGDTRAETLDWLKRHELIKNDDDLIFCRSSKKHCLVGDFCFFVDDTPEIIESMEGIVPHRFVLECPTNRWYDGELRVTWGDIRRHIEGVRW